MNFLYEPQIDTQLLRFINGKCSETEKQKVQEWIDNSHDHRDYFQNLQRLWFFRIQL